MVSSPRLSDQSCPLCEHRVVLPFFTDRRRDYLQCARCSLVFVPSCQHLSSTDEKAIYDLHQNDINDAGYRRFLSRVAEPLAQRLPPDSRGLDFGCGPAPLLAHMLAERGMTVAIYDPLYFAAPQCLQDTYDFVTCTEVAEHFRQPAQSLALLFERVRPGGVLVLMTKLVIDAQAFAQWHYKNDPTHIVFYSRQTLQWLADAYGAQLEFVAADVIFFSL